MSAGAVTSRKAVGKDKSTAKKSFWSMEIGHKTAADEKVEHPAFVPTLPRVDLLPASVHESLARRRILRVTALLAVLLLAGGAALWYLQGSRISEAEAALKAANADQTAIQAKVAQLAPIKEMYKQINDQQELVKTTLMSQPQATAVLEHLYQVAARAAGPNGITFTSASVAYQGLPKAGDPLNACANPDPFGTDIAIGCLTFEATAGSREQISQFLRLLDEDPIFVGPYVDSSTMAVGTEGSPTTVTFTGTSGISTDALAVPLTDEQLQAIIKPPAPAASDAAKATP